MNETLNERMRNYNRQNNHLEDTWRIIFEENRFKVALACVFSVGIWELEVEVSFWIRTLS